MKNVFRFHGKQFQKALLPKNNFSGKKDYNPENEV